MQARVAWGLSGLATACWLIAVLVTGHMSRVAGHWESSLTMLGGSFLSGSSPGGGGAVAFPVFTKALHVPAPVARSFGLSIQAVGMMAASASILVFRRPVHARAVVLGSVSAIVGFLGSVIAFGRSDVVFWPSTIGAPWVKATFSIVLATTSVLMVRHLKGSEAAGPTPEWGPRFDLALVAVAGAGGFLSSLTGTGANIVVFLFLVILAQVNPKVALPSAIMVMAAVSVVGFVLFGLVDGQLDVTVEAGRVVAVGSHTVDLAAGEADLLGLWLAAVPVVVWGAPLGSLAASLVREDSLVRFVALLAAIEVATTFVLVPELRTSIPLVSYFAVGLVALPVAFIVLQRNREAVFVGGRGADRARLGP